MTAKPSNLAVKLQAWRKRISLRHIDYLISVVITVAAVVVWNGTTSLENPSHIFIEHAELSSLDLKFRLRGTRPHDDNIVIVDMDEKTLQSLRAFPIPRRAYAKLLDQLTKGGAKLVVFDVNFPTPEQNSAEDALKKLLAELGDTASEPVVQKVRELEAAGNDDSQFADAIRRNGNVLLAHIFLQSAENAPTISAEMAADYYSLLSNHPFPIVLKTRKPGQKDFDLDAAWRKANPMEPNEISGNIRLLAEPSRSYGFINIVPDDDSIYRRTILLLQYDGEFYPSLDVETVRQWQGVNDDSAIARIDSGGMENVEIGPYSIRTDPDASVVINYAGPYGTYRHYSMIDVMDGAVPPETLRGKLVLVGPTALGYGDRRDTPFPGSYMGVEVHANVIDNILHNGEPGRGFLIRHGREYIIDFITILIFGIGLSYWFSRVRPLLATTIAIVAGALFLAFNYYAFAHWDMWLNTVVPMGTLAGNYLAIVTSRVIFEERDKRKLRMMFERYVSPGVIKLMEDDPNKYFKTGGESKELTMMFSDIRGFTGISEGLTPDQLVHLLNEYLSEMTDILFSSLGTLDKYIGDAVMGFWGSPYPNPDHSALACACALKMSARLDELNLKWQMEGRKALNIGIGLNTGEVNVGNMGSSQRFAWTVMGDPVNLASRLEGTTKAYHVRVLASEAVYEHKFKPRNGPEKLVREDFLFRELDRIRVVGKERPVKIYELMATAKDAARHSERLAHWNSAYQAYLGRNWVEAASRLEAMRKKFPEDGPAEVYLQRVMAFLKNPPPPEWDGVYVLKEK